MCRTLFLFILKLGIILCMVFIWHIACSKGGKPGISLSPKMSKKYKTIIHKNKKEE